MPTRKPRIIKQSSPLRGEQDAYIDRHEKSMIDLLVTKHFEYAKRRVSEAEGRRDILLPVGETVRFSR